MAMHSGAVICILLAALVLGTRQTESSLRHSTQRESSLRSSGPTKGLPVVEISALAEAARGDSALRAPIDISLESLSGVGPSLHLDASSAQEGLNLNFRGEFSPISRLNVFHGDSADSPVRSFLGTSALPSNSRLEIRPSNSTFGRLLVSSVGGGEFENTEPARSTAVEFSTTQASTVYSSGEASEVLFDFSDHFTIDDAVVLDTAVSRQSGDEVLVVYSEGDDFARTELFLPSMESLKIVLGPHDDLLLVRHLPSWFRASLSLDGAGGEDELVIEEDLEENVNGFSVEADKLTIRGALAGPCPVNIVTVSTQIISGTCMCTGPDSISITASGIVFLGGGTIETDDGDITLVATSAGIDGSLGVIFCAGTGDISITSTGDAIIPDLAFGGHLSVTSTSDASPITFQSINAAAFGGAGIISVQAFFVGPTTVRSGIVFTDAVSLGDYDASFHTEIAGLPSTGCVGVELQAINWSQSTTGGTKLLAFTSDISGSTTAPCIGISMDGTLMDLTDVNLLIDSMISISSSSIVAVSLDTAVITGTDSSIDIMGTVNGNSWTGVDIFQGSIDLINSGDISVNVDLNSFGCPGGGCKMISVDTTTWNIVGDTSFNATNRAFAGDAFEGLFTNLAALSGSTLNVAAHGGADSGSGGVAVHITGGSVLTYSGPANIVADSTDVFEPNARAFVMSDSSLTTDNLDLVGLLAGSIISSSNCVGLTFDGATLTATGLIPSQIFGFGAGASSFNGDQNHGVLFVGTNTITTNDANVEINGGGGLFSERSHGVFMATGTLNMFSTGLGVITIAGLAGGPIGGAQVNNCDGIVLSSAIFCGQGTCELTGVCGSSTTFCRGFVAFPGSIAVAPSATLIIDGDGEFATDATGVDLIGTTITLDASATLSLVGQGATGRGIGVIMDASFSSIGVGTKTISIDGTGGGGSFSSNHGIAFATSAVFPGDWQVFLSGQGGGGSGDDNVGLYVGGNLIGASAVNVIATSGSGGGSFNNGMHLVGDLSALNVIDIAASATGSGPNATGFSMDPTATVSSSFGTVQLVASASAGLNKIGCNILGDFSGPGGLSVTCSSSGSGSGSHGILFDVTASSVAVQGSPLLLSGTAPLTSQSYGVYFLNPNGVVPSDPSGSGIAIGGTGYIGVAIASDLAFATAPGVVITGTASPSAQAGSIGVDVGATVSGAIDLDIIGSGGGTGCTSGCFGILQLHLVECTGTLTLDGRSGGGGISVGVRIGAQLRSGSTISVSGVGTDTSDPFVRGYGVDFINAVTIEQPMTVTASHADSVFAYNCHGIVFSAAITLTAGGSLTASGTALASGSGNNGVVLDSGNIVMTSSSNTVTVVGAASCPVCRGAEISSLFGGASCGDPTTPCTFTLFGDAVNGQGLVSFGGHAFVQTDLILTGTSISGDGVSFFGPITTDQQGSIVINGNTTAVGFPGVRFSASAIPLGSGTLSVTAFCPPSTGVLPIFYPAGLSITTKAAGDVQFLSPVLVSGGTVTGPIDLTIADGMTVQGGTLAIASTNTLTWNGASSILSDTSIGGGGFLSLGTPTIDLNGGTLTFLRDVLLTTDVTISSITDICTFSGMIDGMHSLTLDGAGTFVVAGDVGSSMALDTFSLTGSLAIIQFEPGFTAASANTLAFAGDVEVNFSLTSVLRFQSHVFHSHSSLVDPMSMVGSTVEVSSNTVEILGTASVDTLLIDRLLPPMSSRNTTLDGDFSLTSTVMLRSDHFALLRGAFSTIVARDSVIISGGSMGQVTGCFTANDLTFLDSSAFQVEIIGDEASSCSQYDQVSVTGTVTTSSTSLLVGAFGAVVRGETYFILKDFSTLVAPFAHAPEGAAVNMGPVVMFVTYLLDDMDVPGPDVALTANRLPDVMDDTYFLLGGLPVLSVPPPGVLLNDDDPEGESLVASLVSPMSPSEGSVVLQSDGSFVYTSGGFIGVTSFTYSAFDGFESAQGTVTINVLVASPSPTASPTPSLTATSSPSSTRTGTPTTSPTETPTSTPSSTATMTSSPSETPSPTSSVTASNTASRSPSMTESATASATASSSPSQTATSTASPTFTGTSTASQTASPSTTRSESPTPSATTSSTFTPTSTISSGATPSETSAPSKSATRTFSPSKSPSRTTSRTPSKTASPSRSPSPSKSPSKTPSTTRSSTASRSPSSSTTSTVSASRSRSVTPSSSTTNSAAVTTSSSRTSQATPSATPSVTGTPTSTQSLSRTGTSSKSASLSPTGTQSGTSSSSETPSATVTPSSSPTASASPTSSNTGTSTATDTASSTSSSTSTRSARESPTSTRSASASPTPLVDLPSKSRTHTSTPTKVKTEIIAAPNPAPSNSPSRTVSESRSRSASQTRLPGTSATSSPSPIAVADTVQQGNAVIIPTEVTVFDGSELDRFVPIRDIGGVEKGSVILPQNTVGALVITSDTDAVPISSVVSAIVDVTVVGANGELITEFDDPIEICFETDEDEGDVCLGFYNDDGIWECEDYCLTSSGGSVCGETAHLTNFALLLDSSAGSSDKCGSGSSEYVVAYLSIAVLSVAMIAVVILVIIVEIHIRVKAHRKERTFRSIEQASGGLRSD